MKLAAKILFALSFCFSATVFAQAPDTLWTSIFGNENYEYIYSVLPTADGGFLCAGHTQKEDYDFDAYLVKTDENGDTLWTKTFGDNVYSEDIFSMEATSDGGYILAGNRYIEDHKDIYMIKLNADYSLNWEKSFGSADASESISSVEQTFDGGYILCGSYYNNDLPSNWAGAVYKTDADGSLTDWILLDWEWSEEATDVIQTTDSCYIVTGSTNSFANHYYQAFILKLDKNLDSLWINLYGGEKDEYGTHILQTSDGGFFMSGSQQQVQDVLNSNDFYLVKTDSDGVTEWEKNYGEYYNDKANFAVEHPDSGYVICGTGVPEPNSPFSFYIMRLGMNGNKLWQEFYSGGASNNAFCIRNVETGGFIIAGITQSEAYGPLDGYLVRLDEYMTVIESDSPDIIPAQFNLEQNYPNPFNPETVISYYISRQLSVINKVNLSVYNALGQKIAVLVDTKQKAGSHSVVFNADGLASGVYYYRLTAGSFIQTRKMVLLR